MVLFWGLPYLVLLLACAGPQGREAGPSWTQSRLALSDELGLLYVIHRDASLVVALDSSTGEKAWQAHVGEDPRNVDVVRRNGALQVLVSCEGSGEIQALDARSGRELDRYAVGPGPRGFTVFKDRFLAVALYPVHTVVVWDLAREKEIARIPTEPFPTAVVAVPEKEALFVSHFFTGAIRSFHWDGFEPWKELELHPEANQVTALLPVERGDALVVPHIVNNTKQPDLHLANVLFPTVTIVRTDGSELREIGVAFLDQPVNGPEALVFLPGRDLYVTANTRSNDLSAIDRETYLSAGHVRVGRYPLGIVADRDESRLFVANVHEHSISVVDLPSFEETLRWKYGEEILPPRVARGRDLFHDAESLRLVLNQWLSCSNCHPEGHSDGKIWQLPGRPPLRTKDLHGFASTRPGSWLGIFDEMQDEEIFIREFFLGLGLSETPPHEYLGPPNTGISEDLDALSEYVYSLRFAPSPHLDRGRLTPAAERGRRLFHSAAVGCAECHPPPRYTVSSLSENRFCDDLLDPEPSPIPPVDVPSLLGLYLQPAFLHDGRASNVTEIFQKWNASDRHGRTSDLSPEDLRDLEAFLLSLPFEARVDPSDERLATTRFGAGL